VRIERTRQSMRKLRPVHALHSSGWKK